MVWYRGDCTYTLPSYRSYRLTALLAERHAYDLMLLNCKVSNYRFAGNPASNLVSIVVYYTERDGVAVTPLTFVRRLSVSNVGLADSYRDFIPSPCKSRDRIL